MEEILWTAPEFEHRERGAKWYYLAAIITGAVVLLSLWQGNFLFAVFTAIAGALVLFWGTQEPHTIAFVLSDDALAVGGRLRYPLNDFNGFAMDPVRDREGSPHVSVSNGMEEAALENEADFFEIVFSRKASFGTNLKIAAPESLRDRVYELLSAQLPEEEYLGSFTDALLRILKL